MLCVADGRVYERDALLGFWLRRPLADFLGGEPLCSAALLPAHDMRERVQAWLAVHGGHTPEGCDGFGRQGPASTQDELDRASEDIERLARCHAAAAAARVGGLDAEQQLLAACAASIRLVGRTPGRRRTEYLGIYDRCEELGLFFGRSVYVLRGSAAVPEQPMLWFCDNGFWHGGERRFLGQQTGWLIVADEAPSPEHIVSVWKVWEGGRLWLAPNVRCVAGGAQVEGQAAADEAGEYEGEGEGEEEEDVEDEQAAAEAATAAEAIATAATVVSLHGMAPRHAAGDALRYRGEYIRFEGMQLHGRHVYHKCSDARQWLWWVGGYWHFGTAGDVGKMCGALIAHDAAYAPEKVQAAWQVSVWDPAQRTHRWADAPGLRCVASEARVTRRITSMWVMSSLAGPLVLWAFLPWTHALTTWAGLRIAWAVLRDWSQR